MYRERECSRRFLKILEGTVAKRAPTGRQESIRIGISCRSIRQISCSSVAARLTDSIRLSRAVQDKKSMGFGADVKSKQEKDVVQLLAQIQPEDLLKFGLIPEFVGRLPVV